MAATAYHSHWISATPYFQVQVNVYLEHRTSQKTACAVVRMTIVPLLGTGFTLHEQYRAVVER